MASIRVNGQSRTENTPLSVAALLRRLELPTQDGLAVCVNGQVIPRREWEAHPVHGGDAVEVVTAMSGG